MIYVILWRLQIKLTLKNAYVTQFRHKFCPVFHSWTFCSVMMQTMIPRNSVAALCSACGITMQVSISLLGKTWTMKNITFPSDSNVNVYSARFSWNKFHADNLLYWGDLTITSTSGSLCADWSKPFRGFIMSRTPRRVWRRRMGNKTIQNERIDLPQSRLFSFHRANYLMVDDILLFMHTKG